MSNRPKAKKYFNEAYFKSIVKLAEEYRLQEAISEYQKYIKAYPEDVSGYTLYADALIKANRLEEASGILEHASDIINKKTPGVGSDYLMMIKIKLLCCQKKYKECYALFSKNKHVYINSGKSLKKLSLFLRKKLGFLCEADYQNLDYFSKQILDYSEDKALEHIKKHLDSGESSVFIDTFPVEEMYAKLREMLPLEGKVIASNMTDLYLFKYIASGYVSNRLVDYFQVITLQDSNEIIAMYPYENKERRSFIDLAPALEEEPLALKKVSQIEKFNRKYGNFDNKVKK